MLILIMLIYVIAAAILYIKKKTKITKLLLPLIFFSIISAIALGQNYSTSLIPGAYDGIGTSNFLAAFLIGDRTWTTELFLQKFELSLWIAIILVALYFVILIFEKKPEENKFQRYFE